MFIEIQVLAHKQQQCKVCHEDSIYRKVFGKRAVRLGESAYGCVGDEGRVISVHCTLFSKQEEFIKVPTTREVSYPHVYLDFDERFRLLN